MCVSAAESRTATAGAPAAAPAAGSFSAASGTAAVPVAAPRFGSGVITSAPGSNGIALKINRRNSRMTFRAFQIKVVNPSTGAYQSVKRVKLQQLKGSKWKTLKTIKLNSKGSGSYRKSIKKKYRYPPLHHTLGDAGEVLYDQDAQDLIGTG
jgi:hypothetical protein